MDRETPLSPARATAIRDSFARQGLMGTLEARIETLAPGRVVLSMPIAPRVGQQHGFAHAGASFALGDSAAGYSALSVMPEGSEVLTVEMKINLVAPAAGARLVAVGEVVKPGRRLVIVRATVMAEDRDGLRRDVALLQGTMIPA
ncbi:PaaI family thioesterase [Roseibacterium sp. SDUM158017]|uniref:PaaI family thioesterase n=1 Tax=Roseicyclus salinarum TaxID=3036773 RepID=UPI0024150C32|nr:PaaI family thioesterase [Roseibacterium sp. SDUM158017]MDG4648232.1 PaaI family thioesterase [Roseibacterium sp. SDUM158017]